VTAEDRGREKLVLKRQQSNGVTQALRQRDEQKLEAFQADHRAKRRAVRVKELKKQVKFLEDNDLRSQLRREKAGRGQKHEQGGGEAEQKWVHGQKR
jgi:hypothetical protein